MKKLEANLLFILVFGFCLVGAVSGAFASPPFFLAGDGHLKIRNNANGRTCDVKYLNADGSLNEAAYLEIDRVFGFPTALMGENISRRTVAFLDHFADLFNKDATVRLASGYRSQDYNNALRKRGATAAKTSTHIDGMAIDFSLPGVDGKKLWETIREKNCCGAGWYGGGVVHLDSGRPRFWVTETAKVNTGESDFNRHSYVSTEYDRYAAGDEVRLLFTSVSDFGFGLSKTVTFVRDEAGEDKAGEAEIHFKAPLVAVPAKDDASCFLIPERKAARFLHVKLPEKLKSGTYRVRLDVCHKTAPLMPDFRVTNPVEIVK